MANGGPSLTWSFDGLAYQRSVSLLVRDLVGVLGNGTEYGVDQIFSMFPIRADNRQEFLRRRPIIKTHAPANLRLDDADGIELSMGFRDDNLGRLILRLSKSVAFSASQIEGALRLSLTDGLVEVHIPRIDELGLDRSAYQHLAHLQLGPQQAIWTFSDSVHSEKQLVVLIRLDEAAPIHRDSLRMRVASFALKTNTKCGDVGGGPGEDWLLMRREQDGQCLVGQYKPTMSGPWFVIAQGTKEEMDREWETRCTPTCDG